MNNGVLEVGNIRGVEVILSLIPLSNNYARPRNPMKPLSITVHETGNTSVGAGAENHCKYFHNIQKKKSVHFFVDDKSIYQVLPINENAWHAGDGRYGDGNRTSIAIELCVNNDGDFQKTKENAKKLIQHLMQEMDIKLIYPHRHWNGKDCPHNILKDGWNKFAGWVVGYNEVTELERLQQENKHLKSILTGVYNLVKEV